MMVIDEISKGYNKERVLENFSLNIDTSLITSIIAPNGAGKSTLMKLIIGALFLDSGTIQMDKNGKSVSYLSEKEAYPDTFTVREIMAMEGKLYGMKEKDVWKSKAAKAFKLADFKSKKCKELSKGMYRKLAIGKCMLGDPDFLLMDEPFEGLDAIAREKLISLLQERKKAGKGTFLTSHILFEMEKFCDEVVFIKQGKVQFTLSPGREKYQVFSYQDNKNTLVEQQQYLFAVDDSYICTNEQFEKLTHIKDNIELYDHTINTIYKKLYG